MSKVAVKSNSYRPNILKIEIMLFKAYVIEIK